MRKTIFFILITLFCSASAQRKISSSADKKNGNTNILETYPYIADSITSFYTDSLNKLSLKHNIDMITGKTSDLSNPYYYRLFVKPLLYKTALRHAMNIPELGGLSRDMTLPDSRLVADSALNNFFLSLYVDHPYLVNATDEILEKESSIRKDINTRIDHKVQVSDIIKVKDVEDIIEPIEAISRRPNFWTFSNNINSKLMQNYSNDKWYKGGVNYSSMYCRYTLKANYNNRRKLSFNNTLEMNIGFQSDKDDEKHNFKTTEDLLRLTNNLSIKAIGKWSYSLKLQSWTQFHPKYNANSDVVYSDFMSPFESILSVGMDFNENKPKFNINVHLAPLSYDFKYVDRKALTGRYGIRGKHHTYETIGSNMTVDMTWKILKELSWKTRIYYFTNYEKVQAEFENTFKFTVNKYLSTDLTLYPRFDDSYTTTRSDAVLQFQQSLSFGLEFNF